MYYIIKGCVLPRIKKYIFKLKIYKLTNTREKHFSFFRIQSEQATLLLCFCVFCSFLDYKTGLQNVKYKRSVINSSQDALYVLCGCYKKTYKP